jgi:two-component SAPR family response regulator
MARVSRTSGEFNEAMNWLRQAASFPGGVYDQDDYGVELGAIYAAMGQRNLALKEFDAVLKNWGKEGSPKQSQVLAAFLAAETVDGRNGKKLIETYLKQALEGAARLGYDQFLVVASRPVTERLREFKNQPQIKELLERVSELPDGISGLVTENQVEPITPHHLEIRAFGLGEVRQNNANLPNAIWRSNRARALFFYIVDRGRVRKDAIGLDFWPDFSVGKISSNFHATLWRVRQALGFKDAVIFEDEHYSLHPSFQIWYDISEFETYIRQAQDEKTSDREKSELLHQAIGLYTGAYLQDVYMEWADRRRDELKNQFLEALIELARLEVKSKRHREAKRLYERILEIDPYRDEVHLSLMKSLALSGAPSAAIAHFKHYRSLLRKELNAEPLQELQEYYDQLAIKA